MLVQGSKIFLHMRVREQQSRLSRPIPVSFRHTYKFHAVACNGCACRSLFALKSATFYSVSFRGCTNIRPNPYIVRWLEAAAASRPVQSFMMGLPLSF